MSRFLRGCLGIAFALAAACEPTSSCEDALHKLDATAVQNKDSKQSVATLEALAALANSDRCPQEEPRRRAELRLKEWATVTRVRMAETSPGRASASLRAVDDAGQPSGGPSVDLGRQPDGGWPLLLPKRTFDLTLRGAGVDLHEWFDTTSAPDLLVLDPERFKHLAFAERVSLSPVENKSAPAAVTALLGRLYALATLDAEPAAQAAVTCVDLKITEFATPLMLGTRALFTARPAHGLPRRLMEVPLSAWPPKPEVCTLTRVGKSLGGCPADLDAVDVTASADEKEICVVCSGADKSTIRCTSSETSADELLGSAPALSPDGKSLTWVDMRPGNAGRLVLGPLGLGPDKARTLDDLKVLDAAWSRDGTLAWVRRAGDGVELVVQDNAAATPRVLSRAAWVGRPSFTADGAIYAPVRRGRARVAAAARIHLTESAALIGSVGLVEAAGAASLRTLDGSRMRLVLLLPTVLLLFLALGAGRVAPASSRRAMLFGSDPTQVAGSLGLIIAAIAGCAWIGNAAARWGAVNLETISTSVAVLVAAGAVGLVHLWVFWRPGATWRPAEWLAGARAALPASVAHVSKLVDYFPWCVAILAVVARMLALSPRLSLYVGAVALSVDLLRPFRSVPLAPGGAGVLRAGAKAFVATTVLVILVLAGVTDMRLSEFLDFATQAPGIEHGSH